MRYPGPRRSRNVSHDARPRGSALVTVLLLTLLLAAVGLGLTLYTAAEDRASGADRLQNAALYAAETGLRMGEAAIGAGGTPPTKLLEHKSPFDAQPPPPWDDVHLGVVLEGPGKELLRKVPAFGPMADGSRGYFTLYVRNNRGDDAGPTADGDGLINLVSVGWVQGAEGSVVATKIVEEQLQGSQPVWWREIR